MKCALSVLALVFLITGCDNKAPAPPAPEPRIDGDTVTFPPQGTDLAVLVSIPVATQPVRPIRLNGRIAWNEDRTVRVYTPFAGRVQKIMVQPGDTVKAGQALAVIASPEFGQAQAEWRRAESEYALAEKSIVRMRELEQNGVAARKELQAVEAEHRRAEIELERTRARLKLYGANGRSVDQSYFLSSPISGTVVEKNINPGQEIRPDQMVGNAPALFVITDPGALWVLLDAAEKDLPALKPGKEILIHSPAYRDADFMAAIASVSDFLDPNTRTIRVRAVLKNADRRLKGEMFVTAEIARDVRGEMQTAARAVFFLGGKHYVFTDDGGGKFTRREVTAGEVEDGSVAILDGLTEGQRVVIEGTLMLQQVLQPRRILK